MPGFTRWRPDTCECVVEYSNDGETHSQTINVCAKHAALSGMALLNELWAHNRKRNAVLNDLIEQGFNPEEIRVGYDPTAPRDNDPVLVKVLERARKRANLSARDVQDGLMRKFQGIKIVE